MSSWSHYSEEDSYGHYGGDYYGGPYTSGSSSAGWLASGFLGVLLIGAGLVCWHKTNKADEEAKEQEEALAASKAKMELSRVKYRTELEEQDRLLGEANQQANKLKAENTSQQAVSRELKAANDRLVKQKKEIAKELEKHEKEIAYFEGVEADLEEKLQEAIDDDDHHEIEELKSKLKKTQKKLQQADKAWKQAASKAARSRGRAIKVKLLTAEEFGFLNVEVEVEKETAARTYAAGAAGFGIAGGALITAGAIGYSNQNVEAIRTIQATVAEDAEYYDWGLLDQNVHAAYDYYENDARKKSYGKVLLDASGALDAWDTAERNLSNPMVDPAMVAEDEPFELNLEDLQEVNSADGDFNTYSTKDEFFKSMLDSSSEMLSQDQENFNCMDFDELSGEGDEVISHFGDWPAEDATLKNNMELRVFKDYDVDDNQTECFVQIRSEDGGNEVIYRMYTMEEWEHLMNGEGYENGEWREDAFVHPTTGIITDEIVPGASYVANVCCEDCSAASFVVMIVIGIICLILFAFFMYLLAETALDNNGD